MPDDSERWTRRRAARERNRREWRERQQRARLEGRPEPWERRVSAAYLRLIGVSQQDAARAVGRSTRTLREWERDPSWARAQDEARKRWLVDLTDASRRTVLRSVAAGNAELAFRVLERTVPELRPPEQRHRHTGVLGLVALIESLSEEELGRLEALDDAALTAELGRLAAARGATVGLLPLPGAAPGRDVTDVERGPGGPGGPGGPDAGAT